MKKVNKKRAAGYRQLSSLCVEFNLCRVQHSANEEDAAGLYVTDQEHEGVVNGHRLDVRGHACRSHNHACGGGGFSPIFVY